jgi:hypothetical protein
MAHPMAAQAKASQKARLGRLNAKAGKAWGASSMYKVKSYPKKHAGSSTPMTIAGGKGRKRVDRYAGGGAVGGKKRKGHHTTNIIISAPGGSGGHGGGGGLGRGAQPGARPVPVPVRPPIAPAAAPWLAGAGGPPPVMAGGPPVRPPIMPPPGMAGGMPGAARPPLPGMKSGGVVKKADGGSAGRTYPGFPHSPSSGDTDAVSAHSSGGRVSKKANGGPVKDKNGGKGDDDDSDDEALQEVSFDSGSTGPPDAMSAAQQNMPAPSQPSSQKRGGSVKYQRGGLLGVNPAGIPRPAQQGAPTISGAKGMPPQAQTVPLPGNLAARRARPAPGTTFNFKKGGKVAHDDEAQDKALIKRMLKQEEKSEKG